VLRTGQGAALDRGPAALRRRGRAARPVSARTTWRPSVARSPVRRRWSARSAGGPAFVGRLRRRGDAGAAGAAALFVSLPEAGWSALPSRPAAGGGNRCCAPVLHFVPALRVPPSA